MPLLPGENTIGRDPEAEVHFESSNGLTGITVRASFVSKNSARRLTDLGSKERYHSSRAASMEYVGPVFILSLTDGDSIRP
jgi:hypothetical protein